MTDMEMIMSGNMCSFCGENVKDVYLLIEGNGGAYICDECARFINETAIAYRVADRLRERSGETTEPNPPQVAGETE